MFPFLIHILSLFVIIILHCTQVFLAQSQEDFASQFITHIDEREHVSKNIRHMKLLDLESHRICSLAVNDIVEDPHTILYHRTYDLY